ncbi:hypothetical protein A6769_38430 [Nostoc punctiforme NIES-2108]|uniref:Uncharacterized protein n=1 Tax=Nostoc punctiforme NIES-2108 TaxID=1356359 RepID=A0A367S211_NOSPU|nr:hypothetical protein A6769_38430 [Nostoc punctiforme NIES-2108]
MLWQLFIQRKSISLPVPLAFSGFASASATLSGGLINLLFSRFNGGRLFIFLGGWRFVPL